MRKHGPLFLVIAALLVMALAPAGVRGASPNEGTINQPPDDKLGERSRLDYTGSPMVGALVFSETAAAPLCTLPVTPPGQCDVFNLHLNLPADYYLKRLGKVTTHLEITIDWSDAPSASSQDLDLLVFDTAGNQVAGAETDNISSATPHETLSMLAPPGGDYRIITAGIIGTVPSYTGIIRLILTPSEPFNTIAAPDIRFGPGTVVNPTLYASEPGINTDPSMPGWWWIDWPMGTRASTGTLNRSLDDGQTFRLMTNPRCPQRRQPGCITHGGGDTETSISPNGYVYWSNQEGLANEAVNVSVDHGMTWPAERENAISSLDAQNDRQWLATHGDETGYIAASVANGTGLARSDDGGQTWNAINLGVSEVPGSSAPIAVDNTHGKNDGVLYMLTRANGLSIHVSRDKGETFTSFPGTDTPTAGPAAGFNPNPVLIPWMSMDRAGNLYVVWVDDADHGVHMVTMKADDAANAGDKLGSTWSQPVRVSMAPAVSTVFAQVTALDPGRVAIAYQGADIKESSSAAPEGTRWHVYAALSTNALCQWNNGCPGSSPRFAQTQVTHRVNHIDDICVSGIGCTANPNANRNLADFFDLAVDAEGRVGVTWADDNNAAPSDVPFDKSGFGMFAKLTDGPSLRAGKPNFGSTAELKAMALNTISAKAGDAMWPVNEAGGKNFPTLDLLGTTLSVGKDKVDVKMKLASTANLADGLAAGYDGQVIKYVTRWYQGDDVYFVAAETSGGDPQFYGGIIDDNDSLIRTGVTSSYGVTYARDFDVEGTIADGVVSISVPVADVGKPADGQQMLSVQSFTMVGLPAEAQTLFTSPDTIDATPPLDYTVGAAVFPPKQGPIPSVPRVLGGKHLPGTGVADESMAPIVLLLAAALAWRFLNWRRLEH